MDGNKVVGAVFESKSGRQAILAKNVVDATGDGDMFAAAGAEHERRKYNVGLVSRIGNLDKVDQNQGPQDQAQKSGQRHPPSPESTGVNMHGPDIDGIDVKQLTQLELNARRLIWKNVQKIRQTPGYERVYLMETAPPTRRANLARPLGTAHPQDGRRQRRHQIPRRRSRGRRLGREITRNGRFPTGPWVPKNVDNVLAAGRCISGDRLMST